MDDEIDFEKALTEGLAAAQRASVAMDEVNRVIRDAARSVEQATANKLSLYLDAASVEKLNAWTNGVLKGIGLEPRPYAISLHAIFVGHIVNYPDGNSRIERAERICLVRFGDNTYPLIVEWENQNCICNDAHALRVSLSKVLRDARVAKTFQQLISTYTGEAPQPKQLVDAASPDSYASVVADAKRSGAAQDVSIQGDSIKDLRAHVKGIVSVGMIYESYFELRIPIAGLVGIPICKIPYSDIEWAAVNPPDRLNLRIRSTITWNGSELIVN